MVEINFVHRLKLECQCPADNPRYRFSKNWLYFNPQRFTEKSSGNMTVMHQGVFFFLLYLIICLLGVAAKDTQFHLKVIIKH